MTDSVVSITERARAILALSDELDRVEAEIAEERARHARAMEVLRTKREAMEKSIFQFGAN